MGYIWNPGGGGSGATLPSTTNIIKGDGAGNGADSGITTGSAFGFPSPIIITSANSQAFAVGLNGATAPAFQVDASTALQAGGISIQGGTAAGTSTLAAISSGSNQNLTISSLGTGNLVMRGTGASTTIAAGASTQVTIGTSQTSFTNSVRNSTTNTAHLFTGLASGVGGSSLTAGAEVISFHANYAAIQTHGSSTAIALQRDTRFTPNTHAFQTATGTITDAGGLAIDGAPIAGTNCLITRSSTIYSAGRAVGSGVTDSYALNLAPNTGATRNWGAIFPGQLVFASPTPGIAAGTGAGTTPTIAIAGTNEGGIITLTTGTLPTASATIGTITPTNAFPNNCSIELTSANATTATLSGASMVFVTEGTGSWTFTSGTVALTAATAYKWHYQVIGY